MSKKWVNDGVAVEAIDHQGQSKLFDGIAKIIEEVRQAGELTDEAFAKHGLASLIEDACGIAIKVSVVMSPFNGAAIEVPSLDKNHPLIAGIIRHFASNHDLERVKKLNGNKFFGVVDKEDSKVYGVFTKLVCPMYLTSNLLGDDQFSPREIAAIVLHELGHVFSYYERLVDVVTGNYLILAASEKMFKLDSVVDRIEVISEFDKYAGVKIPDKETVAKSNDKGAVYAHLSCEMVKQRRNVEGDEVYSYRGFEFSADQFATRHGAGAELVAAVDKLERATWLNPSYISWPLHIAKEISKVLGLLFATSVPFLTIPMLACGLIVILAARPMDRLYDEPHARLKRIEREMVAELKNRQLTTFRREQVLGDIETVREYTEIVNDKRTLFETIWAYVIPAGNESRKHMEFQQSLERLTSNDLYVASAIFK